MKLTPQHKELLDLYGDGEWRCSVEVKYMRDYRKRISELNTMNREEKNVDMFDSKRCDGRCGTKHGANVHMYQLLEKLPPPPVFYVAHPLIPGKLITTEEYARL